MSTIKCPQCAAEVESQFGFGMVECQSCHHMFMMEEGNDKKLEETFGMDGSIPGVFPE